MRKNIYWLLAVTLSLTALACSCGNSANTQNTANMADATNTAETADTKTSDSKSEEKKETKTSKRKYDKIDADSSPVGVDEVKFVNNDNYTHIEGRIYKNSNEPEEGVINVTFELYDENNKYICEKTIHTDRSLTEGENERFSEHLIWEADDAHKQNVPDENLEKYTAKIVNIKEVDAAEKAAEQELESTLSDIRIAIRYDKAYNQAQILLDAALQKYPDNTDLKLLQAELQDAMAKDGQQ